MPEEDTPTAAPHPEELRVTAEIRAGNSVSLKATARATPAGLIAAAILVSAILIPVVWFARQRRVGP